MKAKRFLAFVAGAAMLFGAVGCAPDVPADDLTKASISVTPTQEAFTLAGGSVTIEVTSNTAWSVETTSDVEITPTSGNGNGSVTINVPESQVDRNIFVKFKAHYDGWIAGDPYPTDDDATVIVFQNGAGEKKYTTNVKAVRDLLMKSENKVDDEVAKMSLVGTIVGAYNANSIYGNMAFDGMYAIQDKSSEAGAGLTIICENTGDKQIPFGKTVVVSLEKATAELYNGLLQLDVNTSVVELDETIDVTPIDVTYDNILDYESQYVKISNVHPDEAAVGKKYSEAASNKNVTFFTNKFEKFYIRINTNAAISDETVVGKSGSVCGISTLYQKSGSSYRDIQLLPQSASDLQLSEEHSYEPEVVTIANITKEAYYKVENAWVVGFTGNGPIITDSSNAFINVYINGNSYKTIGEKMTVVGIVSNRQGGYQFDSPEITKIDGEPVEVTYPTPTNYTEATAVEQLAAKFSGEGAPYLAEYAEFSGMVDISGEHHNLFFTNVDRNVITGSLSKTPNEALQLASFNGKLVKLRGFVTDYNEPYLSIIATSVEIDTSGIALSAENVPLVLKEGVTDSFTKLSSSGLTEEDITVTPDGTVVTAASVDIENGKLIYTVSANSGNARVGTITLSVEGLDDVKVEIKQLGVNDVISTIADVWAGTAESYITIGAQAVASYKSGSYTNIIVADQTGAIALYKPSVTPAIGDYMNIIGGTNTYNGLFQFNAPTVILTGENAAPVHPTPVVKDAAALDGMAATVVAPEYVQYRGVLSVNGSYYNVEIDGANTAIGSLKPMDDDMKNTINGLANMPIIVTGYFYGVSSSKYLNTVPTSVELDTTVKMLQADDIAGVSADGVTDATATIVAANLGAVTATGDGIIVTSASVEGNVLTYSVSPNTTTEVREGTITLSAEGVESVTIKVSQLVADNSTYAMIDKIANLAAGDYYMAGYLESYTSGGNTTDFSANPWHLCIGVISSGQIETTSYSYSDAGELNPITGAEKFAKNVTLVAVDGKSNAFYVKFGEKYLYSSVANTTNKLALGDTPAEWVVSDHEDGGIMLTSNGVYLGTAKATKNHLRAYKGESSLSKGAYFFKKN